MVGICHSLAAAAAAATAQAEPAKEPNADEQVIIVTGERVTRTLQETASSVSVWTEAEIEAQPVDRVEQVLAAIPNVQLGHGSEGPAIRGQDTTGALQALPAFLGGNRPRTTVVVDGRAVTYNEFIFGVQSAWDVNRIEVYRSPQTTTQGQNSIAGAIFVFTNEPSFDWQYRARLTGGDYRNRQVSALASGPLNADVALRVTGDLRNSRTTSEIFDAVEDADPNHDVFGLVRAKLLLKPAAMPNSRLLLTYSHSQSQAPQVVRVTVPLRERRDRSGGYGVFRVKVDSLTASARHEAGSLTANVLVTAGDSRVKRLAPTGFGQAQIDGRDWSGEAVLSWGAPGPLRLIGGVSHRHNMLKQRIDLSVLLGIPQFRDWQDGTGLFGEASVRLAPRATLTAGIRYQHDRQKRIGEFETASGPIDLDYDRSFDAWLPKLALAYELSSAATVGVLVQRAYHPGGTTLRFDIAQPDNFEAETLWDYEAFLRATIAGGRLTANVNAFYYDMRNAQRAKDIFILAPNGRFAGFADLFNVPRARSYGLEAELRWRPARRLSAGVGLGLLRSKIVKAGPDYPEFEGRNFGRAPHLSAFASVDWHPVERLRLSAQARHHGPYWSDSAGTPFTRVDSGTIVDARAEYSWGRVSLFGYARNLFDTFSITSRNEFSATLEDPREVGFGLDARF